MTELLPFEQEVMEKLLSGNDSALSILREQLKVALITERKNTGAGFFVDFYIPNGVPRIPNDLSFEVGDVGAKLNDKKIDVGFVLFVKKGMLIMLEGYTYEEIWPEEISNFELYYHSKGERNFDALQKIMHPS